MDSGLKLWGITTASAFVLSDDSPTLVKASARLAKVVFGTRIQICDGTADDVQIQAALDAVPGGKVVLLEGTYVLAAYIDIGSNQTLEGMGEATFIDATGLAYAYLGAIRIKGLLPGTSSALTGDAAKGQLDVAVADASGFSVGDWIRIRDDNPWPGGQESAELQRIASIAVNTITCELTLADGYTVADTGTVDLVTIVEGVHLRNFKIQGWGNQALAADFEWGYNHSVEHVALLDFGYAAVEFQDCVTCRATGNLIERCNEAGMGYGVVGTNCARDIIVSSNHFYDCRHATSFGGGAGGYGISRNCIADGNTCYYSSLPTYQQFDTHPGAEHITISNNTVIGAQLAVARCSHVLITGNYCEANYHAIELRESASECSVTGNYLVVPGNFFNINCSSSNHLIEGNILINQGGLAGVRLLPGNGYAVSDVAILSNKFHCTGDCIMLGYTQAGILASENITIVGNELISDTGFGVDINNTRVALKHLLINGNKFKIYRGGVYFAGAAPGSTEDILISDNLISLSAYWASMYGCIRTLDGVVVPNLDIFDNIMIDARYGIYLGNATSSVRMKGNRCIDLTGTTYNWSMGVNPDYSNNYTDLFMDVLAVSATHVRANEDLSAGIPITFTIDAQPDVPRTLSGHFDAHANITAYSITITGRNAKGWFISEIKTEADGWDWETNDAFATITSIIMTARTGTGVADTMDIGITDVLGLANIIHLTGDVYKIKKNNADYPAASYTTNATYDTVDVSPGGAIVGGDDFTIWYRSNLNIVS